MTNAPGRTAPSVPIWVLPAGRAVAAIVLGLVITFSTDHSALLGLVGFGVFAVVTALLIGVVALRTPAAESLAAGSRPGSLTRGASFAQAAVTLVAGIAALAVPNGGVEYLVLVVSGWAVIAGALELASGLRSRARGTRSAASTSFASTSAASTSAASTDAIVVGIMTVVLGIVVLVIPPDLAIPFAGEKGIAGVVTSAVVVVGVIGFWAVITGVLMAIAAASPRQHAGREPRA